MTVSLRELEEQAMTLPEDQRASLAAHLIDSLPALLHDDDLGMAQAIRRDSEIDQNPSAAMSLEEFKKALGR